MASPFKSSMNLCETFFFPNNVCMKNHTDLNLGGVVYVYQLLPIGNF